RENRWRQVAECAALFEIANQEEVEVVAEVDFAVIGVIALRPRSSSIGQTIKKTREVRGVDDTIEVAVAVVREFHDDGVCRELDAVEGVEGNVASFGIAE